MASENIQFLEEMKMKSCESGLQVFHIFLK